MVGYSNKYHNIKTKTADGIEHDSRKEANRWCELKLLERAGKITNLQRQVKYLLIPAQIEVYARYGKKGQRLKDGERVIEKECSYIADFVYHIAEDSKLVVEDTKGIKTKEYIIKRKLMLWIYHIRINEI